MLQIFVKTSILGHWFLIFHWLLDNQLKGKGIGEGEQIGSIYTHHSLVMDFLYHCQTQLISHATFSHQRQISL